MDYFLFFWFLIMGVVVIALSVGNAEWFFNNPSVHYFTARLGREATRVIYIIIGLLLLLSAGLFFIKEIYPTL